MLAPTYLLLLPLLPRCLLGLPPRSLLPLGPLPPLPLLLRSQGRPLPRRLLPLPLGCLGHRGLLRLLLLR